MANSAKAIQIYQIFKKHLEQQKFHFEERAEELIISLTVHGDDLPQPTIIRVMDERSLVQVLSPLPTKIPEDKRVDTAVAVCVANYGMINGSFDFDMTDGEIWAQDTTVVINKASYPEGILYRFTITLVQESET